MSDRRETPDPTPVAWPAGVRRPETLAEQIRRMVRLHVSQMAQEQGFESFEEADDFDSDDDDEFRSPYELTEMQEEAIMGRDASNLERRKPRRSEDGETDEGSGTDRVADSAGVSAVLKDRVREVPSESSERSGATGVAEGHRSGRGAA